MVGKIGRIIWSMKNWHILGIPYTTFPTLSIKTVWSHLIVLLKLSGYNIMSYSRWLEKIGRISGNMKNWHILGGTPYFLRGWRYAVDVLHCCWSFFSYGCEWSPLLEAGLVEECIVVGPCFEVGGLNSTLYYILIKNGLFFSILWRDAVV